MISCTYPLINQQLLAEKLIESEYFALHTDGSNGDDRVASAAVLGQGVACRCLTSQSITIDTVILPTLTFASLTDKYKKILKISKG